MTLAALLLASASLVDQGPVPRLRVVLVEETVEIPRAQWRSFEVALKQQPATVECQFRVTRGDAVRVALMSRAETERLRTGRDHQVLAETPFQKAGELRHPLPAPGDFQVIVVAAAGARASSDVELQIALLFPGGHRVKVLSAERRAIVVVVSAMFFVAVVAWCGARLVRQWHRHSCL